MLLTSYSPEDTQRFAKQLSILLKQGDCITLNGDLGAGKTCLAKGLIHALTGEPIDTITSPTFTLCQEYLNHKQSICFYHYDLYRLEDESELEQLGFEEHLEQGITLIEWPEIAKDYLPTSRLEISISVGADDERNIALNPLGDWHERLAALSSLHG